MKSIKQEILQNRIQMQNKKERSRINEINEYKGKIKDVHWYLYSIATRIFEKQSDYIKHLDEFLKSSTLEEPQKILEINWIEDKKKVDCNEHFENIADINRHMFYLGTKDWMAECKPLMDLIANLNLKFEDKAWKQYAETNFENDWVVVTARACRYSDQFQDYYDHEIKYKYTDKMKSKIINHYQNEGLNVFENEKGVFVTL